MITVKGLYKDFEGLKVLRGIDQHVETGEKLVVIGPSGSGKSTFLRCLNLLEMPTAGSIVFDGEEITAKNVDINRVRRKMGMVFQQFNLFPHKTVLDNITLAPVRLKTMEKEDAKKRALALLERVGLSDKADVYPAQLSGGQKQRVGIARALATDPEVLLCDEATSALDPETTRSILALLRQVNRELGITILLITHEIPVIKEICDRVAVIDDGLIVEQGNVFDVFVAPQHETTQALIAGEIEAALPKSLRRIINNGAPRDGENPVVKIVFTGPNAYDPIISQLSRIAGIDFNILAGQVDYIQNRPFGILFVEAKGGLAEAEKAIAFVQSRNLKAEIIGHVDPDSVPLG